jgi:penicillin-binding protein 1A
MKRLLTIRLLWVSLVLGLISFFGLFILAGNGTFGEMPEFEQLENPNTNLATQIISSDGEILGKFYFNDNRTPITFGELPDNLVNALIATEDERFYDHPGIDVRSTLRAVAFLNTRGGASTISQQLARQLFVGVRSRSTFQAVLQKAKEWVLAIQIEKRYTKNEIIAMYLNVYDFGNTADGVISASKIYFNKTPDSLLIEDAATLVGMLKNSSYYNPLRRPKIVTERRNVVFQQMFRNEMITKDERDSLTTLPLKIDYSPESHREGLATYFRAYLQGFMNKWLRENPKPDGSRYNLYRDGIRIYTTIDSRLQTIAEESVNQHMKSLQSEFFAQNKESEENPTPPFRDLRDGQVDTLIKLSAMRSERWRKLKLGGKNEDEIWDTFQVETPMKVFSWNGDIDTIMKPIDSIRYYKFHLRASMMSMEPQTGHIKAWVGGFNYKHFQYDQVRQGRRQIGSTFKPFFICNCHRSIKAFTLLYSPGCSLLYRANEAWEHECLVSIKF